MKNCRGYFITGTDTGVGKTLVTLGLMQVLQAQGKTVAAMKPVAAGCRQTQAGLRNEDALRLQQQASMELDYALINPYAFAPAVAPHIAAEQVGMRISIDNIINKYNEIGGVSECVLVEGAGGWEVPLNVDETLADLAVTLGLGVILVVGLRLGCLNHALLSAQAINGRGCTLVGWVANHVLPDFEAGKANISALEARLACPRLATIPHETEISAKYVADRLRI